MLSRTHKKGPHCITRPFFCVFYTRVEQFLNPEPFALSSANQKRRRCTHAAQTLKAAEAEEGKKNRGKMKKNGTWASMRGSQRNVRTDRPEEGGKKKMKKNNNERKEKQMKNGQPEERENR
jgi:hypothetical protein